MTKYIRPRPLKMLVNDCASKMFPINWAVPHSRKRIGIPRKRTQIRYGIKNRPGNIEAYEIELK